MSSYSLIGIIICINLFSTVLAKVFQQKLKSGVYNIIQYNFFNALIACVFLFFANRLVININSTTFVFAIVFALFAIISLSLQYIAYSCVAISLISIMSTSGAIISPTVFGIVFFNEPLTLRLVLSVICILSALFIPLVRRNSFGLTKKGLVICLIYILYSGLPTILSQLYAKNEYVVDSFSYFFITNAIILVLCGAALFFLVTKYKIKKQEIPPVLGIKQIANIAVRCLLSQGVSLLSILILKEMAASVYSVTTTALGLVGSAFLSKFLFKEKFPPENIPALTLAVAAVIIGQ